MNSVPDWNELLTNFIHAWNKGDYYTKNVEAEVDAVQQALRTRKGPPKLREWGRDLVKSWDNGDFYTKELDMSAEWAEDLLRMRLANNESGMSLRKDLIRLAHDRPDLRPALLPVLKEAGRGSASGYVEDSMMKALDALNLAYGGMDYRFSRDGKIESLSRDDLKKVSDAKWTVTQALRKIKEALDTLKDVDLGYTGQHRYGGDRTARHRLDGVRGHTLMPANVKSKLPDIGGQEDVSDPMVYVRYFSPYSGAVWLITEFDGQDEMFGWAELFPGGGELGYMSLRDLEGQERRGLPLIERDLYFRPKALSQAKRD